MRGVGGGNFFFHITPFMKKLHFTPVSCPPPFADKMQKKKKKKKKRQPVLQAITIFNCFPKWKID